ncbi:MAG: transferrin-binding protein-like solute binding protein [Defluviicoccus sp.]|nr:transferrin-binding protein-like solute binding protein [Defluviicoccus sp.]
MQTETRRFTTVLVSMAALLFLAACGGGDSTTSMMDDGMTGGGMTGGGTPGGGTGGGMTGGGTGGSTPGGGTGGGMTEPMPELMPAMGLTPSDATRTPEFARNAGDTIEALLPTAMNQFAPLSAGLKTDFGAPGRGRSATLSDDVHIKAISSDGAGGLHVTYVLDGEERKIHFSASDLGSGTSPTTFYKQTQDGSRYWFWSYADTNRRNRTNRGSTEFAYLDVHGGSFDFEPGQGRVLFTYGVRTESDDLPAGSATYGGRMYADRYPMDDPRSSARTRNNGDVQLTVDFSQATVNGTIVRFRVQEPGQSQVVLPPTSYVEVSEGQIVDGQFTASLKGVGSGLSGLEGDMLGEFYGPAAEEAGGALNATFGSDVLVGWFGVAKFDLDPSTPQGTLSDPLSVAVDRDFVTGTAEEDPDTAVTSIRGDGADGFNITYTVDGQVETVHLQPSDATILGALGIAYSKATADGGFTLNDETGSLSGSPLFQHFAVHGWSATVLASDDTYASFRRGFLTYGVETGAANLPAGTASYSGSVAGNTWTGPSFFAHRGIFTGDLSLPRTSMPARWAVRSPEYSTRGLETPTSAL